MHYRIVHTGAKRQVFMLGLRLYPNILLRKLPKCWHSVKADLALNKTDIRVVIIDHHDSLVTLRHDLLIVVVELAFSASPTIKF